MSKNAPKKTPPRKTKIEKIVEQLTQPKNDKPTFKLGDKEIEVVSLYNRGVGKSKEEGLKHYRESADFVTYIIPLITRVWGAIEAAGDYDFSVGSLDVMAFINDLKLYDLIAEIRDTIPRMVAIVAHGTHPDMTEEDVMCLAGAMYNPELFKAIFYQLVVDGLLGMATGVISGLGGGAANEQQPAK